MALRRLYVSRTLRNANDLIAWAKAQGFSKTMRDGDLHVTVAYSKEPFETGALAPSGHGLITQQGERSVKALGDGNAIVLRFDSPDIEARWRELRAAGASWDWPSYQPQATFTWQAGDIDLSTVEPFRGPLIFGPEVFADINDDWKSGVVEKSELERRMAELSLFLPLTKIDAENRLVYGVATAESPDRAQEICDYASTKPFYEKWSGGISKATEGKSFGNLRAMHGKVAAGKLTALAFNDDAKQIEVCAKVVDDGEWKKVQEGVYTGFSQGGAYIKRWKDDAGAMRYTADPSEISLVDLPCLPSATFQVLKANGAAETKRFAESVQIAEPAAPSNDAVAQKAAALAEEAGRKGEVGDFIAPAREALVKAAEAEALAKAQSPPDAPPPVAAEPAPPEPAQTEASPALGGEVEQVWKAKDGTTFAKKADAIAHNAAKDAEAAAGVTTKPVLDALADLTKRVVGEEKPAEPKVEPAKTAERAAERVAPADLEKTLYGVSRLACLLAEVKDLQTSAAFDAAYTGEASDVPAKIKAWAVQGCALLGMIVEHEMNTMVGAGGDLEMAAGKLSDEVYGALCKAVPHESEGGKALAKIGARNSKSDQEKVQAVHDHAVGLGAACKKANEAGKVAGGDLAKGAEAIEAVRAELVKITGERDVLQKTLTEQVLPQIAALTKMIGDQPVPRHLVGRAVTKNAETGAEPPSADDIRAALEKMTPDERSTLMIKLAQAQPQHLSLVR